MTIGDKIRIARTANGFTQKELGFLVGLSDDRIGHYEIDRRTPKDSVIEKISASTGFSLEYFTDHKLTSPINVMHVLFELKQNYGLSLEMALDKDGEPILENGRHVYKTTIGNMELDKRVSVWLKSIESIKQMRQENGNDLDKGMEDECLKWEGQYPQSLVARSEAMLRNEKNNRSENPSD